MEGLRDPTFNTICHNLFEVKFIRVHRSAMLLSIKIAVNTSRFQEFHQKASSLLKLCHEAETGAEPGGAGGAEAAAESLLAGLAQARKLVLEAAVFTLQVRSTCGKDK